MYSELDGPEAFDSCVTLPFAGTPPGVFLEGA